MADAGELPATDVDFEEGDHQGRLKRPRVEASGSASSSGILAPERDADLHEAGTRVLQAPAPTSLTVLATTVATVVDNQDAWVPCRSLDAVLHAITSGMQQVKATYIEVGEAGAARIVAALATNPDLSALHLCHSYINHTALAVLAELLKESSGVMQLNLECIKTCRGLHAPCMGDQGAQVLAEALKVNSDLTILHLSHNEIADEGAVALAESLKVNCAVTSLDLGFNRIGVQGVRALADAFNINCSLTKLNLQANDIGAQGALTLAEVVKINSGLEYLNLAANNLGSRGAEALAAALATKGGLSVLNLDKNNIGDLGAAALTGTLALDVGLSVLSLQHNRIGDRGARALAEALPLQPSLAQICLECNHIGDDGAAALAGALRGKSGLTFLNLQDNMIKTRDVACLLEAPSCQVDVPSVRASTVLSRAKSGSDCLVLLDLSTNAIGSIGAGVLAQALRSDGGVLDIRHNDWDDDAERILAKVGEASNAVAVIVGDQDCPHLFWTQVERVFDRRQATNVRRRILTLGLQEGQAVCRRMSGQTVNIVSADSVDDLTINDWCRRIAKSEKMPLCRLGFVTAEAASISVNSRLFVRRALMV